MFAFTSIEHYHDYLSTHAEGCVEAVNHYLQAIQAKQHLNCYLEVFAEEALLRAKQLDTDRKEGKPLGKLHGVICSIKDVICYKDHQLTAASRILEGFVSLYNATVVEKLLQEGAIIIGRNNCDEFAMGSSSENSAYGIVRNAANEDCVPGGSSGGSAVAVQAGLCMFSLGSDTGGSVRQPADFCGLVGIKPTYGRISRYGLIAYASSFDQIGILAHSVADAALVLEVIAGSDDYDSTVSSQPVPTYSHSISKALSPKRIAYFKATMEHPSIDPEIKAHLHQLIDELKAQGHIVEPVAFDWLDYIVPTYYILTTAEASSNLSRYDGVRYGHRTDAKNIDLTTMYKASRSEAFGMEVQRRILLGTFVLSAGYFDAYFTKAQQVRRLLSQTTTDIFSNYDFILSPTVTSTAFKIGEKSDDPVAMYMADIFTVFANLVGIPSIALPLFQHSNGMPFGAQLMAKHFDESDLLAFSAQLMEGRGK